MVKIVVFAGYLSVGLNSYSTSLRHYVDLFICEVNCNFIDREHDKKVCLLGLTSLISLPADQLPPEALERVFKSTLELLVSYKDQVEGAFFYNFCHPFCDFG